MTHLPPTDELLTVLDVELLERLYDCESEGSIHLKGRALQRARDRLTPRGMLEPGRLGPAYVVVTPKGRSFVETIRRARDN